MHPDHHKKLEWRSEEQAKKKNKAILKAAEDSAGTSVGAPLSSVNDRRWLEIYRRQ